MRGARSLDQKLAPQEFLADLFWAAHEILGQPSVAFVSIVVWVLPVLVQPRPRELDAKTFVLELASFYSVGWVGAERLFFLRRQKGQAVTLDTLLRAGLRFFGRFFRLGCLMSAPVIFLVFLLMDHGKLSSAPRVGLAIFFVVMDFSLTFVTPALVFTTRSVREALRIGWQMIRQTWPRSGLYVLCPPLALTMLNYVYRTQLPFLAVATTAALTLLALLAKGATVAFYLRERPARPDVVGAPL
jgi:hypothetical protein